MSRIKMLMAQAEGAFTLTIITRDAAGVGIRGVSVRWSSASSRAVTCSPRKPVRSPLSVPNWSTNSHPAKSADWTPTATASSKVPSPSNTPSPRSTGLLLPARLDLRGKLVHSTRQRLGRELARKAPVDADVVVAVPDSGTRTPSDSPRKQASRTPRIHQEPLCRAPFIEPARASRSKVRMKFSRSPTASPASAWS